MSVIFQSALLLHIILGILAMVASVTLWMVFLKRIQNFRLIKFSAGATFFLLLGSWISGGYYYLYYYGASVRSVILSGPYPWAHKIVMEAKEHIFLFLPFLAAVVFFAVLRFREGEAISPVLLRGLAILITAMTTLIVLMALGGIAISGAVRP